MMVERSLFLIQSCLKIQQSAPVSSTRQDSHVHKVHSCLTESQNEHISLNFLRTRYTTIVRGTASVTNLYRE